MGDRKGGGIGAVGEKIRTLAPGKDSVGIALGGCDPEPNAFRKRESRQGKEEGRTKALGVSLP